MERGRRMAGAAPVRVSFVVSSMAAPAAELDLVQADVVFVLASVRSIYRSEKLMMSSGMPRRAALAICSCVLTVRSISRACEAIASPRFGNI